MTLATSNQPKAVRLPWPGLTRVRVYRQPSGMYRFGHRVGSKSMFASFRGAEADAFAAAVALQQTLPPIHKQEITLPRTISANFRAAADLAESGRLTRLRRLPGEDALTWLCRSVRMEDSHVGMCREQIVFKDAADKASAAYEAFRSIEETFHTYRTLSTALREAFADCRQEMLYLGHLHAEEIARCAINLSQGRG